MAQDLAQLLTLATMAGTVWLCNRYWISWLEKQVLVTLKS